MHKYRRNKKKQDISDSLCKMVNPCSESEAKIPGKDVAKTEHQENKAPMSALSRQRFRHVDRY